MPISCAFVIPGDLALPTGGYAYDRQLLARLPAHGIETRHVALPGGWPQPTAADLAVTAAELARLPSDAVLLVDGLAYGAMPEDLIRRLPQRIVALCHHPLGHEAGLAPSRAAELLASERAALALAHHVVVTSRTTARTLVGELGVRTERIAVAEPGTERAERASGSGDGVALPLRLLAVGSLVPRKGYDVLVAALAGLAPARPIDWRLDIAGSDDRSPETTRALRDQIDAAGKGASVRLLGPATEAEVARLYAAADLFVMPSLYEGYGMVLTEAMARGLPIVCTTGGAAAETVPDAAAIKVPPGDAIAFRRALERVMADAALRRLMADAAWDGARLLPTWDGTARIVAGVIERVART